MLWLLEWLHAEVFSTGNPILAAVSMYLCMLASKPTMPVGEVVESGVLEGLSLFHNRWVCRVAPTVVGWFFVAEPASVEQRPFVAVVDCQAQCGTLLPAVQHLVVTQCFVTQVQPSIRTRNENRG
jgi:hypothetical protein